MAPSYVTVTDASHGSPQTSYAVVTAARDEAENLPRLARCLANQTLRPVAWVVVENGSRDDTLAVVQDLEARYPWITVVCLSGGPRLTRGGPIARAIHAGLAALNSQKPDVVVVADADISMPDDHFEHLIKEFNADSTVGIASGSRWERVHGHWRQQFLTSTSVEASCRAYRWECLQDVLPFEERMGWVGLAEIKAIVRGWKTQVLLDLPFRHHRDTGVRERTRTYGWFAEGGAAWYMGYRPYYLVLRSLHRARRDSRALAMILGYTVAALRREPRHDEAAIRAYVRREQSLLKLRRRTDEALGRREPVQGAASSANTKS